MNDILIPWMNIFRGLFPDLFLLCIGIPIFGCRFWSTVGTFGCSSCVPHSQATRNCARGQGLWTGASQGDWAEKGESNTRICPSFLFSQFPTDRLKNILPWGRVDGE